MRVTHTAPSPPSPLLGAVPTSSCSTIWPLRVSTPTRAPQGGATGGRSRREAPVHSCPLASSYFDFVQTSTSVRRRTSVSTSVSTRRGATGVSAPLDIASWQTGRHVKVGTTCCPRQPCSRTCMLIKRCLCAYKDVDECLEENVQCGANQMCFNMRGSSQCIETPCPPNYQRDPTTG